MTSRDRIDSAPQSSRVTRVVIARDGLDDDKRQLVLVNQGMGVSIPLVELKFIQGSQKSWWMFYKVLSRPFRLWLDIVRVASPETYWKAMESPTLDDLAQWVQDQLDLINDFEQFMTVCSLKG